MYFRNSIEWTEHYIFPLMSKCVCVLMVAWLTGLYEVNSDVLTTIPVGEISNWMRLLSPRTTGVTWVPDSSRLWVGLDWG